MQVPRSYDEPLLRAMFEDFGPVYQLNVLRDKATLQSRGTPNPLQSHGAIDEHNFRGFGNFPLLLLHLFENERVDNVIEKATSQTNQRSGHTLRRVLPKRSAEMGARKVWVQNRSHN